MSHLISPVTLQWPLIWALEVVSLFRKDYNACIAQNGSIGESPWLTRFRESTVVRCTLWHHWYLRDVFHFTLERNLYTIISAWCIWFYNTNIKKFSPYLVKIFLWNTVSAEKLIQASLTFLQLYLLHVKENVLFAFLCLIYTKHVYLANISISLPVWEFFLQLNTTQCVSLCHIYIHIHT